MNQARMPWILGSVAVLVLIAALAAASYHTTADIYSTLKAAGVQPQKMHPYKPPAPPQG